ncbi:MAG: hypothetical protein IPI67_08260 [Myxococcales bacterium]|nr:hypothetical protein [Myxococcales bacterium]
MKDKRVGVFKKALEELVESLDATVRLAQWDGTESVPDPLKDSASSLMARLGTADRLAAGVFKGTIADVARVTALTDAMRRLEVAYVSYRKNSGGAAGNGDKATRELSTTLDEVKAQSLSPD